MGNWEYLYLEIYHEVHRLGVQDAFYEMVEELSSQREHRYKGMRELWSMAFKQLIRNAA